MAAETVSLLELFSGFARIGLMGFGGVAPVARHVIVEERKWLDDRDYAAVLGVGQILPGANVLNGAGMTGAIPGSSLGILPLDPLIHRIAPREALSPRRLKRVFPLINELVMLRLVDGPIASFVPSTNRISPRPLPFALSRVFSAMPDPTCRERPPARTDGVTATAFAISSAFAGSDAPVSANATSISPRTNSRTIANPIPFTPRESDYPN